MKRGTFKTKSFEEKLEKQAKKREKLLEKVKKHPPEGHRMPVARRKPLKKVSLNKKAGKKRNKLPTVKSMRNKCDALLTPIIKKMYPYCVFTGQPTEVAHHAIKKSTSSALRYYLPNLIPLTHKSHMRLHSDEILWTGRLIALKGLDWWSDLEEKKNVYTKCDVHFYIEQHKRLTSILNGV